MNTARNRAERAPSELTPEARRDRAKRKLAEATAELVAAQIEIAVSANDDVSQFDSPLGRRRHCELAREGAFPSKKVGRRILVKRADMQAYIDKEGLARGERTDDEEIDDIVGGWTGGSR